MSEEASQTTESERENVEVDTSTIPSPEKVSEPPKEEHQQPEEVFEEFEEEEDTAMRLICDTTLVNEDYIQSLNRRVQKFTVSRMQNKDSGGDYEMTEEIKHAAKVARSERVKGMKFVHNTILDMVALLLDIDYSVVLEGFLDFQTHLDLVNSFVSKYGRLAVVFIYQTLPSVPIECGREVEGPKKRVVVSDGSDYPITKEAVVVYRVDNNVEIEHANASELLIYAKLETVRNFDSAEVNIVAALQTFLKATASDAVSVNSRWGELSKSTLGMQAKEEFLGQLGAFDAFLTTTKEDLAKRVVFASPEEMVGRIIALPERDRKKIVLKHPSLANEAERLVKQWYDRIELVLEESSQVRREKEDLGPRAELEYWRTQLTKSYSIMDFLSFESVQYVVSCLRGSPSRCVQRWGSLSDRVRLVCNEATDNVKYLYDLGRFSQPLYTSSPESLAEHVRSLLYTVRMIYQSSRYYNTSERVTAIFVKITNQLVQSCLDYLTEKRTRIIWQLNKKDIIAKMRVCLGLHLRYRQFFAQMQKSIEENPKERPLVCSEANIFVRFQSFSCRLEKLISALETYLLYSILQSACIEGMDVYIKKFESAFTELVTKPYDPLDDRKPAFDADYQIFKWKVTNFEKDIKTFCEQAVNCCVNVTSALRLLSRFDELNLECLCVNRVYIGLIQKFYSEICYIRDRYNEDRDCIQVPWNMPVISGKIYWARNLFRKIEEPMEMFKRKKVALEHSSAQAIIRQYNSLGKVLLYFEWLHHESWCEILARIESDLDIPLLIRDDLNRLHVNKACHNVFEAIDEAAAMAALGLEIPREAATLIARRDRLLYVQSHLNLLVNKYTRVRRAVPKMYLPLMGPVLFGLEAAFEPALATITWSSLQIVSYLEQVTRKVEATQHFLDEIAEIKTTRIDEPITALSLVPMLNLTTEEALPAEELLYLSIKSEKVENTFYDDTVREINNKIVSIEIAVIEMIDKFVDTFNAKGVGGEKYLWLDPDKLFLAATSLISIPIGDNDQEAFAHNERVSELDLERFQASCMQVYAGFFSRLCDALTSAVSSSLENLRYRLLEWNVAKPLISAYLKLVIPHTLVQPELDEIQGIIRKLVRAALDITKDLKMWAQQRNVTKEKPSSSLSTEAIDTAGEGNHNHHPSDEGAAPPPVLQPMTSMFNVPGLKGKQKSYFKIISENKEVVRLVQNMHGAILLYAPDVRSCAQEYLRFSYLWANDREERIANFVVLDSKFYDLEEKMREFVGYEKDVANIVPSHQIGPLLLHTDQVKSALAMEASSWRLCYGRNIISSYVKKIKTFLDFIKERNKVLNRQINDLDDVRSAMACLDLIRGNFIEMHNDLQLIEDTFGMLYANKISVPDDHAKKVDTLRYTYETMLASARSLQDTLSEVQGPFQKDLLDKIEEFKIDEAKFHREFEANGPTQPGLPAQEASDRLTVFQLKLDDLSQRLERNADGERLFGLPVTEFPNMVERKKQLNLLSRLYTLYEQVSQTTAKYLATPWSDLNVETFVNDLTEFQNRYKKMPKSLMEYPAYMELVQKVDTFRECCPLLEVMATAAVKKRHWERMSLITGYMFPYDSENFQLKHVMQAPLLRFRDELEDICIGAMKEQEVEAKLKAVLADWYVTMLSFSTFKQRGEVLLKGQETSEIIAMLDDSLMVLGSLFTNRYNGPFKRDIQLWMKKLSKTSEMLEIWLQVQNLWLYLEAVFGSGDIARQLPKEAKRFQNINKTWVSMVSRARGVGLVVEACAGDETTQQLLPHLLEQLESCQKSLAGYLDTLRAAFPRFFFVSDPTLLEILGQASDSHSIQNHLLNVFENVYLVEFDEKVYDRIIGIYSREMEHIPLEREIIATGGVETWLSNLLQACQSSVNIVIGNIVNEMQQPEYELIEVLNNFPAQIGLLGIQFLWTHDSEDALRKSRIDKYIMRDTNQAFLKLLNLLIDQTTKDLAKFTRVKYETLITIHVHQRDIFDELYRKKIKNVLDFNWLKNMRFYWDQDNRETIVKVTDVNFIYQNEFLGCTERLVITPLTDRCYITLAQAIGMSMGGAPAGPAGTGKTETTKDMAKCLGKYCVVFNCSDQMDFRGLGRIFKGLAQSGSWGCFDEFNRIDLPVLSVAAQQISIVLTARKEKKTRFIFSDGDDVPLNPEFGLFITMNPGYAGRQELPENLKIMFRPIAMMVPDRQIIMRVKLASCGFRENITLARKFYTLYKLCEEQLSKQVHYDFGLRNILSVLRTLGTQKRANPNDSEELTVMSVLRYMNLSKLVDEDEPLFLSLIEDLFPGNKVKLLSYKDLQKAITQTCLEMELVNYPPWNLKMIQLYETSLVRHGLMILGPTGSGKTTCTQVLMRAMTLIGNPHREMRMNPKAITAPQMFGRLDIATNDWTDGIFSTLWRRTLKVKSENIWIVLDGPVDAVWIENLNSVLDDNKTLTLANGDRISMAPNCKLLFEPDNVNNASPATVSRMGMVFLSSSVMSWQPILQGWLIKRPDYESQILQPLFDRIYQDLQVFLTSKLQPKMLIMEAIYIRQCCDILAGLLRDFDDTRVISSDHWERMFLFSLMWSLGGALELKCRMKLEAFVLSHPSKMQWPKVTEGDTIFEFYVDGTGAWEHWSQRVEEYLYPEDSVPDYFSILVPNIDNVRTAFLIHTVADQKKAVLLIGEQGTAKTVMMKSFLSEFDIEYHTSKIYNFSSATTPNMFQRVIESYVEKRVGSMYGPPGGRKMTIFIDDINMPVVNEWGDQITNEIVRQLMEMKGFYSLEKPGEFLTILDMQFVAAMIHPGGGRNDIPHRLKRQFSVFNCTLPSDKSMDKIFSVIGEGYFCHTRFNAEIVAFLPRLIPLTRLVWQSVKNKMLPTPAKFHYIFNLRDLSRIWQGILNIQGPECQTKKQLLSLWQHECKRVISDRFVSHADQQLFYEDLAKIARQELQADAEHFSEEDRYFADFLRDAPEPTGDEPEDMTFEAPKIYEEIPSWEVVRKKLQEYMTAYNENVRGAKLDLVFFTDAIRHLIIISRTIRTPRGSLVMVGVGGSGKQSLVKLASFIANHKTHQIQLTRAYNVSNFLDDLKFLYRVAGLQGQGISFLFTDNDIKDETFLEHLNNVLSAGEVANLFAKDELEDISNQLIPVMKKEYPRRPPTMDNLYEYFIQRSRSNLHILLGFSPVGTKFRTRAMKFPGLISGCTLDWFQKWPVEALIAVSKHFLQNFDIVCTDPVKGQLIEMMADVHELTTTACVQYFDRFRRQIHITPKSFLSFLEIYKTTYSSRLANINMLNDRMSVGVQKLVEAAVGVDLLRKQLAVKEKDIAVASAAANEVLREVSVKQQATEKVKSELVVVKERAEALVATIAQETLVAENKLLAAKPALDAAENALKTIKASDIATVRKLGKPPYLITVIMDVVLILFQKRLIPVQIDPERPFFSTSWSESLKLMADTRFLVKLQNFPKDLINAEIVDLMKPYLALSDYTYEKAKTVCGNVAGLIQWTVAMVDFYQVNKEVLPLKANLAIMQAKLQGAQKQLSEAQQLLDAKQRELDEVQAVFNAAYAKQQAVLADAMAVKTKMDTASALISGLTGERQRWTEACVQFKVEIERLVGDVVIITAFLSYTGPFNQEFRDYLCRIWSDVLETRKIPASAKLNLNKCLIDSATIGEWNVYGLPTDDLSVQNGIIVTKSSRYPLLIDPQTQGKAWIKNMERANDLQVTTLTHRYLRTYVEECISLGRPLLIEDIAEELDPILDNVLEKNYLKSGLSLKVKVGDKEVDINPNFRLYITTKLPNPAFPPEIAARTSIIDFTVTIKGLEDQLLGRVIVSEKKELEIERVNLIKGVTSNQRQMEELEAGLLQKLSTVQGSLVDDQEVVRMLNFSKDTAADLRVKLEVAVKTESKINNARDEFRPVASRGSTIYFLITQMALVNCMYQTSLAQFLERFDISIERSEKHIIPAKRIHFINEYLTFELFRNQTRGLYEVHKFMFVLLLALKIDLQRDIVSYDEFQCLIKGGAALDLNVCPPKPYPWISDTAWLNLVQLSSLHKFQNILDHVAKNERQWKNWFDKEMPEEEALPEGYNNLDAFKKLLLIRSWCPDRTFAQGRKYIISSLGARFAEPFILSMEEMLEESRPLTPIVCFLSMGSDPTPNIEKLAKTMMVPCRAISMGQGQEIHARKLVSRSMAEGGWVLLQNCHLGLDYMQEVFVLLTECESVDKDFRLWITTDVDEGFPVSLLQMSIKYTNEAPQGVRANLKRTYFDMSQDVLELNDSPMYLSLLFILCFFHSVVQGRRKFGPLGMNIPYEFNASDWIASLTFIRGHLDTLTGKTTMVNWTTMRYMLGEIQYGGRVTDDYDKRLINTMVRYYFKDEIFSDSFEIYPGYPVLKFKQLPQYGPVIDTFNTSDPPQIYGLHSNANIAFQTNSTRAMMQTIMSIQPKEAAGGSGTTREEIVKKIAWEMVNKMPPNYDFHEVRERLKLMGYQQPMNIFLRQEIDRMERVISLVKKTCNELLLAIEGTIVMNDNLRDALDNIYDAQIPAIWLRNSWSSSSLGFWFSELLERNLQFTQWLWKSRPNHFWMTGFFNPQGFLTAMRQEVARAHRGWPLDAVVLHNVVLKQYREEMMSSGAPEGQGVYVYGLYIEGAGWDKRNARLCEAPPKVLAVPMPLVHMYAINTTDMRKDPKQDLYECPVYKKPQRTDLTFITPLWLVPSPFSVEHWIMRGVALLCDIK